MVVYVGKGDWLYNHDEDLGMHQESLEHAKDIVIKKIEEMKLLDVIRELLDMNVNLDGFNDPLVEETSRQLARICNVIEDF